MGIAYEATRLDALPFIGDGNLPTPDEFRGLSIGETGDKFGTAGLYVRFQDNLERYGLADQEEIGEALDLALLLHADDLRTNGHQHDHILRVASRILEHYQIHDRDLTIASLMHDTVEDHARELVYLLTDQTEWIEDERAARERAFTLVGAKFGDKPAGIIRGVTNPLREPGQDKQTVYLQHTVGLIFGPSPYTPYIRVLKLADFTDNATGNHHTVGERQLILDAKYLGAYGLHAAGLYAPDSLIDGERREWLADQLQRGEERTLRRLASAAIAEN